MVTVGIKLREMLIRQFATFDITLDYLQLSVVFFYSDVFPVCVCVYVCVCVCHPQRYEHTRIYYTHVCTHKYLIKYVILTYYCNNYVRPTCTFCQELNSWRNSSRSTCFKPMPDCMAIVLLPVYLTSPLNLMKINHIHWHYIFSLMYM